MCNHDGKYIYPPRIQPFDHPTLNESSGGEDMKGYLN